MSRRRGGIVKPRQIARSRGECHPRFRKFWDGLVVGAIPNGRQIYEFRRKRIADTISAGLIATKWGQGITQVTSGADLVHTVPPSLQSSNRFSVVVIAKSPLYGTDDVACSIRNGTSLSGLWSFNPFDTSGSGRFELYWAGFAVVGIDGRYSDNIPHVFHFSAFGGDIGEYGFTVDGTDFYNGILNGRSLSGTLTDITMGSGGAGTRAFNHVGGGILGVFVWDHPHSKREIAQLATNPFAPWTRWRPGRWGTSVAVVTENIHTRFHRYAVQEVF